MHVFSDKNKHIQALTSRERKFLEHSLLGLKVPWSESSRERKFQGVKGTFAPGNFCRGVSITTTLQYYFSIFDY